MAGPLSIATCAAALAATLTGCGSGMVDDPAVAGTMTGSAAHGATWTSVLNDTSSAVSLLVCAPVCAPRRVALRAHGETRIAASQGLVYVEIVGTKPHRCGVGEAGTRRLRLSRALVCFRPDVLGSRP
jgi:hypothetical protein